MTKMATMPIYMAKTLTILKLGMDHQRLKVYKVYINYDPDLTYFTARSNLVKIAFCASYRSTGPLAYLIPFGEVCKAIFCTKNNFKLITQCALGDRN